MELLVVVVIIGVVLAMLLPGLALSKTKAQALLCINNLKQLQVAWAMYAEDHQDWLPGVAGGSFPGAGKWVSGWLDFSSNPDNTNTLLLTDSRFAQIGPYIKTPEPFHCPSDPSAVRLDGRTYPRVRSVSMNCWMNYVGKADIGQDRYQVFRRTAQIVEPTPSKAWVLIDEREDSLNDGMFQIDLKLRGKSARIMDYPAGRHNHGAGISFADGHAMIKRWQDLRTVPSLTTSQLLQLDVPSPYNPDVAWLQERSSALKPVME